MARNDSRFTTHADDHDAPSGANDLAASVADTEFDLEEFSPDPRQEEEEKFLRTPRRVPVRKSAVTRKTAVRLRVIFIAAAMLFAFGASAAALVSYGAHSWRFRVESSDDIQMEGLTKVTRAQVMEVMGADLGRNIFKVPLDERKKKLEEIPWVETATVMRLLPNKLRIRITERHPVAFVRIGPKAQLIDAGGVIMDLPGKNAGAQQYSFPVITGFTDSEPLSTRAARMRIYARLSSDLDAGGANYSKDLSEVDLSDPEDVKVTVEDPQGALVIHLGGDNFLDRYRIYIKHISEWRTQFQKLESVDLRYSGQVIVNQDPGAQRPAGQK